jgi:hypothetical protein
LCVQLCAACLPVAEEDGVMQHAERCCSIQLCAVSVPLVLLPVLVLLLQGSPAAGC